MVLGIRCGTFGVASVAFALAALPSAAQNGAVERPAEIRVGACAGAGEVVAPLSSLIVPAGEPLGQIGAMPVEQSVTMVPLPVANFLGASHMVVVYTSPQESTVPVACGDIGGAFSADGTLAVGMTAVNGSKLDGVAYFAPTPAGDATTVTLLLIDGQSDRERDERDRAANTEPDGGERDRVAEPDGAARAGENGIAGADGVVASDGQPGQPGQPGEDGADGGQGGRGGDGGAGGDGGVGGNGGNGESGGDGGRGGDGGDGG